MNQLRHSITIGLLLFCATALTATPFDALREREVRIGFSVQNVYLNGKDQAFGSRLIHTPTGFTLDLFEIQSVPQAFLWVNSVPNSDMGEPHTCEHLLLGKGTKGKYVASLEDMSLGRSTAYTSQIYTAYPFKSQGGNDIFFELLQAKLDAMLHPNYSDEEIRREVCHVGITPDPATGALRLEERGTVYTEMVSSTEQYWYPLYGTMSDLVYGIDHPLSYNSGGLPDAIRKMQPADLHTFHRRCYRLDNMGMVVTIPTEITLDQFLEKANIILTSLSPNPTSSESVKPVKVTLPPPRPSANPGEVRLAQYPGGNAEEPGQMLFTWPAQLTFDLKEGLLLRTFMYCLGGSQTSDLYNKFVDSKTRIEDLGASGVTTDVDDEIGHAVSVTIDDVKPSLVTKEKMSALAGSIQDAVAAIAAYKPGAPELVDFNNRAVSRLKQLRREAENYLNMPPGFGDRSGAGGRWYTVVRRLEEKGGFRKSLLFKDDFDYALERLAQNENIWTALIAKWKLLTTKPFAVGCTANPELMTKAIDEKNNRIAGYTEQIKKDYAVSEEAAAIARFKEQYDKNTGVIEASSSSIPMPSFLANPPMSFDPLLKYRMDTIAGTIPLVSSEFASMTSATVGLALRADVIPEKELIYLPILPDILTQVGVIEAGKAVDYPTMSERLKNEVLSLDGSLASNFTTGRMELMITGAGGNLQESKQAIHWIESALFSPYLDKANLARIRDVVNNRLTALRSRTKTSEENWVSIPAMAYRYQNNPLLLAGGCFLTQEHLVLALKWRLSWSDDPKVMADVIRLLDILDASGKGKSGEELLTLANGIAEENGSAAPELNDALAKTSPDVRTILAAAAADLATTLPTAPEATAAGDWSYLIGVMKKGLSYGVDKALEDIQHALELLCHQKNARLYMVSNADDGRQLMPEIISLAGRLASRGLPQRQTYSNRPLIQQRMKQRYPEMTVPTYVGLVHTSTRNGVFYYLSPCASVNDSDSEKLLDFLAAKLYGGGGAHSMFMKTWGAGLAYSNGLRSSEISGDLLYYAERCPDISATMRFVVNELKQAPQDAKLAEYAVAQTFAANRAADNYQSRGAAMAANYADGITPDKVAAFRQRILLLRERKDLYDLLQARMTNVYGRVLIGLDSPLRAERGMYFIIGPDPQFEKLSAYVTATEGPATIYKIYPRDYWLTL